MWQNLTQEKRVCVYPTSVLYIYTERERPCTKPLLKWSCRFNQDKLCNYVFTCNVHQAWDVHVRTLTSKRYSVLSPFQVYMMCVCLCMHVWVQALPLYKYLIYQKQAPPKNQLLVKRPRI